MADLHWKNNTFPGEEYLRVCAEVLTDTAAAGAGAGDWHPGSLAVDIARDVWLSSSAVLC